MADPVPDPDHQPTRQDVTLPDAPHGPLAPPGATLPYLGPAATAPSQLFGGYELLTELGRGGMGVVYKARQSELQRIVAVKMILSGTGSTPDEVQRFRTEAEAMARLQHANIVQVFEVGTVEGRAFYSMEFIDGPSLAQRVKECTLPNREAARVLAIIARAIHHAHLQGILHRDLKPSNIVLTRDNQPKVTDFGLAKKLDAPSGKTRTGVVMGTPSYMAPEQAGGRVRELGPATDVYSLGAVLYEMLTGRPPFESESTLDTLMHVMERQPAPPRLLNAKVDRDLETICLKCLEKSPKHRYASAAALADDLERYLNGEAIAASSFNVLDRLQRALERDHYLAEFHTWGTMLLVFAGIVLVEHLFVFALTLGGPPYPKMWIMGARFAQFALMALVFLRHRRHTLLPTSLAERQLWAIWVGYLTACMIVGAVHIQLTRRTPERDELMNYPFWSALTGMAFFAMGSCYWWRFLSLRLAFSTLPPLELPTPRWVVLEYGLLWTLSLTWLGLHLHALGKTNHERTSP